MKLCLISDTHNTHDEFEIEPCDLFIHAGDFTNLGQFKEIARFSEWLDKVPAKHKVIIPGNHDILFEEEWGNACSLLPDDVHALNQSAVEIEGIKIWGEPRTPEFMNWAFNVPRLKMKEVWDKVPDDIDILVTHGPPKHCRDMTPRGEPVGCAFQRAMILKHPTLKMVVCGHIHEAYGHEKLGDVDVYNVAVLDLYATRTKYPIYLEYG